MFGCFKSDEVDFAGARPNGDEVFKGRVWGPSKTLQTNELALNLSMVYPQALWLLHPDHFPLHETLSPS